MPVQGGIEIVVLPHGEPDPLAPVAEPPAAIIEGKDLTVIIRPQPTPANEPTPQK